MARHCTQWAEGKKPKASKVAKPAKVKKFKLPKRDTFEKRWDWWDSSGTMPKKYEGMGPEEAEALYLRDKRRRDKKK